MNDTELGRQKASVARADAAELVSTFVLGLSHVAVDSVVADPFPHLIVDNALPRALADELAATFPSRPSFTRWKPYTSNQKFLRFAPDVLSDDAIGPAWKTYFADLERTVLPECLRLFGAHLLAVYPDFESRFAPLHALRTTPHSPTGPGPEVFVDSMLLMHTPVTGRASVERGPHIKIAQHVVLGYLTLRAPGDDSAGGDFVLYAPRPGAALRFHERQTTDEQCLETRRIVPRRHNSLFLFLNSGRSIQAVSARPVTPYPVIAHHFALRVGAPPFALPMAPGVRMLVPDRGPSVARTLHVLKENAGRWVRSQRNRA